MPFQIKGTGPASSGGGGGGGGGSTSPLDIAAGIDQSTDINQLQTLLNSANGVLGSPTDNALASTANTGTIHGRLRQVSADLNILRTEGNWNYAVARVDSLAGRYLAGHEVFYRSFGNAAHAGNLVNITTGTAYVAIGTSPTLELSSNFDFNPSGNIIGSASSPIITAGANGNAIQQLKSIGVSSADSAAELQGIAVTSQTLLARTESSSLGLGENIEPGTTGGLLIGNAIQGTIGDNFLSDTAQAVRTTSQAALITSTVKHNQSRFTGGTYGVVIFDTPTSVNVTLNQPGNFLVLRGSATKRVIVDRIVATIVSSNTTTRVVNGLMIAKIIGTGTPALTNGVLTPPMAINGSSAATATLWVAANSTGTQLTGVTTASQGVISVVTFKCNSSANDSNSPTLFHEEPIELLGPDQYLVVRLALTNVGALNSPSASINWTEL